MLFSAKESFFNAWFPLTGQWLEQREAEVLPDLVTHTFTVRLARPYR